MVQQRHGPRQPARTVLEQLIRERQQTFEEFVEYVATFARNHEEPGTLSLRHLQRLVAGRRPNGTPPGPLRPATARLLERIFGVNVAELLASPAWTSEVPEAEDRTSYDVQPLRVAIAVVVNESEVLVVCRRGSNKDDTAWQFPAGIVKPGGSPELVAVNETFSETRVHSKVRCRLGSRRHPATGVLCHYLLCDYLNGDVMNADPLENIDANWIDKTRLTCFMPHGQIFWPVLNALDIDPYDMSPYRYTANDL